MTLFYFILALLILVIVHEYGHFQVARWCGIKVLRFSFGFGKILAQWKDKKGTDYVWSLFPLGGYVKMLDETEGEVAESETHLAFNRKPIGIRMAVVVAGPLFNFLLAFVLLWCASIIGVQSLAPLIGSIKADSIAAKAGLSAEEEILFLGSNKINSWRDFQYAMMPLIGSGETVKLTVKSTATGIQKEISLPLINWHLDSKKPDLLGSIGIVPFLPKYPTEVGEVLPDNPAEKAGILKNDKIISMNGEPLDDWDTLTNYVKEHPNGTLKMVVQRADAQKAFALTIGEKITDGKKEGFIGLLSKKANWPEHWLRTEKETPLGAVVLAARQTYQLTASTFILLGRLATGKLALDSISGPVGIAQGAGDSGRHGVVHYLFFLAIMSISLGVLNLLPIPMLDGGHLLYYTIELIIGRPVPEKAKTIGLYIGVTLLGALMIIAFKNDLSRLIPHLIS